MAMSQICNMNFRLVKICTRSSDVNPDKLDMHAGRSRRDATIELDYLKNFFSENTM